MTRCPAWRATRRRAALGGLLALCVHAAFLAVVALRRADDASPPDKIVQVVLVDLAPRHDRPNRPVAAPSASKARKTEDRPVAPAPRAPAGRGPVLQGQARDWLVREESPEAGRGRTALRQGLGCRSADLLAVTEEERRGCDEKLAAGSETAPTYAVVSPKLKKAFDGTFECPKDDAWCEYRIGKAPYPGLFARRKKPERWD